MDERVGRSPHDCHCRSNFVQDVRICTGSSDGCFDENTVFAGHRLIENKISVRFNEPDRGEIVIINDPDLPERLIKRVVGLPGETIHIANGEVWIDGTRLEEPYVKGKTYPSTLSMPYTIPEDHVFVMGDNREHSMDSRSMGAIPLAHVEGTTAFRVWPLSAFGSLD